MLKEPVDPGLRGGRGRVNDDERIRRAILRVVYMACGVLGRVGLRKRRVTSLRMTIEGDVGFDSDTLSVLCYADSLDKYHCDD